MAIDRKDVEVSDVCALRWRLAPALGQSYRFVFI